MCKDYTQKQSYYFCGSAESNYLPVLCGFVWFCDTTADSDTSGIPSTFLCCMFKM